MYGLTGVASGFATENNLTIQTAGLVDGAASSTATGTTSGCSKGVVIDDTAIVGHDIATAAVPEGSQGPEELARMTENLSNSKTGNEVIQEIPEPAKSSANKAAGDAAVQSVPDDADVSYNNGR